ncbi:MAG: hypothetical protein ABIP54_03885 [Candidatus Andersenbacteria bacterium]
MHIRNFVQNFQQKELPLNPLPKILDALGGDASYIKLIRPALGQDLIALNETDSETSLAPRSMTLRKLQLQRDTAVPFHCHVQREKTYLCTQSSSTTVLILVDGEVKKFLLQEPWDRVTIPSKYPHAIVHRSVRPGEILIISSSHDPDDVQWEEGLDELLTNKHQQKQ